MSNFGVKKPNCLYELVGKMTVEMLICVDNVRAYAILKMVFSSFIKVLSC